VKRRLRAIVDWADSRAPRERVLLIVTALTVLYGGWNAVLVEPLREEQDAVTARIGDLEKKVRGLKAQEQRILEEHGADPDEALRQRARSLRSQIEALDARIHEHTVPLIPPREMARFLEEVLAEQTGLRLVRFSNLVPEPMLELPGSEEGEPAAGAGVYKHGFVIEVRGGYLSMLRYLEALEQLPWSFFWESVEYEVQEHPEGIARIRAYTISTEEGWIGA